MATLTKKELYETIKDMPENAKVIVEGCKEGVYLCLPIAEAYHNDILNEMILLC